MKVKIFLTLIVGFLVLLPFIAMSADLPRKSKTPRESYPNVDVIYDSVIGADGERLRTIITKPHAVTGKLPVIFLAGWLSCDSAEAPADTKDATGKLFRELAQLPGFCLFRLDKPGCGDSEGDCSATDFETELAGYRAAFLALKNYDFIDTGRVYMLGVSNGGGFAPLVPATHSEQNQVRGYVVIGGWVKTWFEHMLEIERRRFGLMKKSPEEVSERMKLATSLYYEWLIKGRRVDDVIHESAGLAEIWPEGNDHAHLYGRPLAFYEQLQKLNLASAWSRVKVPTLVLHGQFDWIMSREDHELIAQFVNNNRPGGARFVEVPAMGHTGQHYLSLTDAFAGHEASFDRKPARTIIDWLEQTEKQSTVNEHE